MKRRLRERPPRRLHRPRGVPVMCWVSFWVPGAPAPQGSKRHVGKGILIESSKAVGPWRERVALVAHQAMRDAGVGIMTGVPVAVFLGFHMPRPASAPKTRFVPAIKRPDADKLARAALDAITGVMISDDSQVVDLRIEKQLTLHGDSRGPGLFARVALITGQAVTQ